MNRPHASEPNPPDPGATAEPEPGSARVHYLEALTESTGAGNTIHGDFLFTEVIDDSEQDR